MSRGDTGSIKFLGGRVKGSEDPRKTAIREAREEGGVDLGRIASSIFELPYQDNDPKRPSCWYGVNTPRYDSQELTVGDDVLDLFWVTLNQVESKLTYDKWKRHWSEKLLPALIA
jgi:8-oxo-dGTP pyrophosphatase MutT (NUDIX family)